MAPQTQWLARHETLGFAPVADAQAQLAALLTLYRRGLAEPLRLENPTTIEPGDRVSHLVYDVSR